MRQIKYIGLHCTAGPQDQTVPVIRAYWRSLGWKVDGYHHLITPDGTDHNLVPIEKISNGIAGYNSELINISYVGGVELIKIKNSKGVPINAIGRPLDNRTDCQKETMERLVRKYHLMFPEAEIKGHRDFSPDKNRDGIITPSEWMKSCPSFSVATWLKEINL